MCAVLTLRSVLCYYGNGLSCILQSGCRLLMCGTGQIHTVHLQTCTKSQHMTWININNGKHHRAPVTHMGQVYEIISSQPLKSKRHSHSDLSDSLMNKSCLNPFWRHLKPYFTLVKQKLELQYKRSQSAFSVSWLPGHGWRKWHQFTEMPFLNSGSRRCPKTTDHPLDIFRPSSRRLSQCSLNNYDPD